MKRAVIAGALALMALAITAALVARVQAQAAPEKDATGVTNTQPIQVFNVGQTPVNSVAFSPDGAKVLTGGGTIHWNDNGVAVLLDCPAKLWDAATGSVLQTFTGHTSIVTSVAFSPDGTKVLTGSYDDTAKLWDATTGAVLRTFIGHTSAVNSVAFSPDGTKVLTGSYDDTAKLWDAATGAVLQMFNAEWFGVTSVAFSADGTKVLTGSGELVNMAWLWDAATGALLQRYNAVSSVAFSRDGMRVLAGLGYTATLLDAATGGVLQTFTGHTQDVDSVALSPDGTMALTGSSDKTAKLWDTATGIALETFSGQTLYISSVAFSPDGMKVLTGSGDGTAKLWDVATGIASITVSVLPADATTGGAAWSIDNGTTWYGSGVTLVHAAVSSVALTFKPLTGWITPANQFFTLSVGQSVMASGEYALAVGVPDVVGLAQGAAQTAISNAGLTVGTVIQQSSLAVPVGQISSQDPAPGATVASGTPVNLFVSQGALVVSVPSLVGMTQSAAQAAVMDVGLTLGTIAEQYSSTVPAGQVLGQNPAAGAGVDPETPISLTVSQGSAPVSVPNVVGMSQGAAQTVIINAGLTVNIFDQEYSSTVPSGCVIAQIPANGAIVVSGTPINLRVSQGPQPVSVPYLVGMIPDAAQMAITDAGLTVGTVTTQDSSTIPAGLVSTQTPTGGSYVLPGTIVNIVVSSGGTVTQPLQVYGLGEVYAVAFSPDGHHVLLGGAANAYLYNADTHERERVFTGHTSGVNSVAFSPDGTKVLTGSGDETARLWDVATGAVLQTFAGHESGISSVAFSPNGTKVLTGSWDYTAKLWDATAGAALQTFRIGDEVTSVAFSPDGTKVLTGSMATNNEAMLFDATTGAVLQTFRNEDDGHYVSSVTFSPDGAKVLTGSSDGEAKLWNAATGAAIQTWSPGWVGCVAFSPDGTKVAAGCWYSGTAMLWDASTDAVLQTLTGHTGYVRSVTFSPDSTKVLTGSDDMTAKLWDVATGTNLWTFSGYTGSVASVATSPDETKVLTASGATATLWNAATGSVLQTFSTAGDTYWLSSVAFSPDGTKVLTGSWDHTAKLWDAATGTDLWTFSGYTGSVNSVAFSPDGTKVLTGDSGQQNRDGAYINGTAKLWDVVTHTLLRTFSGHTAPVRSVAFSPDGTQVLTGAGGLDYDDAVDCTAKLWDVATGTVLRTFSGDWAPVNSVAFNPDGTKVLTGAGGTYYVDQDGDGYTVWVDCTARLWDAVTGALIQTFYAHTDIVTSVAFGPYGTKELTGSNDHTANLWDAAAGSQTFYGHTDIVTSVAFTPDGTKVLTGSDDGTARLWAVAVEPNSVTVTLHPLAVITAGARWSIDNGATWNSSGATLSNLATGSVTITFKPLTGWITPGNQSLTITDTQTAAATSEYGSCTLSVPNVVAMSQSAAQTAITNEGLTMGIVTQQHSSTVPAGQVISQNPAAGSGVPSATAVSLTVSQGPQPVSVPNVVGMAQNAAETAITNVLLSLGIITYTYNAAPLDDVICQDPLGGWNVAPGTPVALVVSQGPAPITVPNVVGATQSFAQMAITNDLLSLGTVTQAYSLTVPIGDVISQDPLAGSNVASGTLVALVISQGPQPITVPNVVGMTQTAAQTAITNAGLIVGSVTQQYNSTVAAGQVISQDPTMGANPAPGMAVNLTVSQGPAPVAVPNVVGMTQSAAEAAITAAMLVIGTETQAYSDTVPSGTVISQDPAAGVSIAPNTAVNLVVSKGVVPVAVPNVVGMTQSAAEAAITGAKLAVGTETQAYSDTTLAGTVISQDPIGGTSVAPGTAVSLVISKGVAPVAVPNVVGMTQSAAVAAITGAKLAVGTETQAYSDTVATGTVISQDPAAGVSVVPATAVSLVISKGVAPVAVRNVVGMTQSAAETAITGAKLAVGTETQAYSDTVSSGTVISQDPAASTSVAPNTAVNLVVSKGVAPVAVPNVVGMTQSAAEAAITGAKLTVGTETQTYSDTVSSGTVISQDPAVGASVAPSTAVNLVVSKGVAPVAVPNVVGMTQSAAETAITGAKLAVGTETQTYSDSVPAGTVISQDPAASASVAPGTAVSLVISKGVAPVGVPNVVGMTQSAAEAAITGAKLVVGTETQAYSDTVPTGAVISQDPAAGTPVPPNTPVNLVVSQGVAPVPVPDVTGMASVDAQTTLLGVQLAVGTTTEEYSATLAAGQVISQDPLPGISVPPDTPVNIVVSKGANSGEGEGEGEGQDTPGGCFGGTLSNPPSGRSGGAVGDVFLLAGALALMTARLPRRSTMRPL